MEQLQRGACYLRVSTADQLEFSPDAQLRAIKNYATNNNIILDDEYIFIDEGISGRKAEKRPAFQKMIATAKMKPKPFDVILVHKFDRFARSREDSVVYKSLLKKECGVKVVSITESIEDDKFSVILEAMLEAMAEYYSLNLSDEVKKGMSEKARKGGILTGASFGYKLENDNYIIIPEEAEIIKLVYENFVYEDMPLLGIAKLLNSMGVKTHRGNKFEHRTIEHILRSPVYIGKIRWTSSGKRKRSDYSNPNTIIAQGKHEPIITEELFNLAQKKIARNKAIFPRHRQIPISEYTWWLRGLLRCSACGNTIVKSGFGYLHCNAYAKGSCMSNSSILLKDMEAIILNQLKHDINATETPKISLISKDKSENELIIAETQLSKIDAKLTRAKQLYLDGIDTIDEYKQNKKMIENEQLLLNKKINELSKKETNLDKKLFSITLKNVYETLINDNVDMKTKYNIAHSIIKNIIFDKENSIIRIEYYLESA